MPKLILKELKGKKDIDSLIKRWHILNRERAGHIAPLRITLEKHQVEHMLIEKLRRMM